MVRQELSDHQLVERCLTGNSAAWATLRRRHLGALAAFIRRLLEGGKDAGRRAEELAEEVIESLLMPGPERLRRFQPTRAPFPAYLRALALQAVQLDYRKNKRRAKREREIGERDFAHAGGDDAALTLLREEFVSSLSPREQKFCRQELLGEADPAGSVEYSMAQVYKLRQRILKKAKEFCKNDGGGVKKRVSTKTLKGVSKKRRGAH
jgi:DNA-directed RNA polymerase specialized sigma24 family protein